MRLLALLTGIALIGVILFDGFEAMVLPRRVTRRLRPARVYYRSAWYTWTMLARLLPLGKQRNNFLSIFGPFSLLALFASWVFTLVVGFALVQVGIGTKFTGAPPTAGFTAFLYQSGETFFTLGYGDVTTTTTLGRALAVFEAGIGFGFMAVIIGYLPALYQAFSQREQTIALLDARAGSPPTAFACLTRLARGRRNWAMDQYFDEWERWAANLLESHLSFPVLSYYRSQHDNQSWLAALAAILDTSAIALVLGPEEVKHNAQLTFAMSRHVAVDLSLVFWRPPTQPPRDRLTSAEFAELLKIPELVPSAPDVAQAEARLAHLRTLYEPFLESLSRYFLLPLPRFLSDHATVDNWQTSAWTKRTPGIGRLPVIGPGDEHFD